MKNDKFLTIDDMILCPFNENTITFIKQSPSGSVINRQHSPDYDNRMSTAEPGAFILHIGETALDYLKQVEIMPTVVPAFPWRLYGLINMGRKFNTKVINGDPGDRATWQIYAEYDGCFVNLLSRDEIAEWYDNNRSTPHRDEERTTYNIPIRFL